MNRFLLSVLASLWAGMATAVAATPPADDDMAMVNAYRGLQAQDARLSAIGYRLVTANARWCADRIAAIGLGLHDMEQYADREAAFHSFGGTGKLVMVNVVVPGSEADKAGIKPGDEIVAVDGADIDQLSRDEEDPPAYARLAAINRAIQLSLADGKVDLRIARWSHAITIGGPPACTSIFEVTPDRELNASANGTIISVTSALIEYAPDDQELAAVVAHELAHNMLRHRERLNAQNVNRGMLGQLGKSAGRIKETEIEADRLSVWLLADAGYDPQAAIRFWSRFGREHGKGIFSAPTHYRWKKRVVLIEGEIAAMTIARGDNADAAPPLLPAAPVATPTFTPIPPDRMPSQNPGSTSPPADVPKRNILLKQQR